MIAHHRIQSKKVAKEVFERVPQLAGLVERCLQYTPNQRPSANEIITALEKGGFPFSSNVNNDTYSLLYNLQESESLDPTELVTNKSITKEVEKTQRVESAKEIKKQPSWNYLPITVFFLIILIFMFFTLMNKDQTITADVSKQVESSWLEHQLTTSNWPLGPQGFSISPDGKSIAFLNWKFPGDIWFLEHSF